MCAASRPFTKATPLNMRRHPGTGVALGKRPTAETAHTNPTFMQTQQRCSDAEPRTEPGAERAQTSSSLTANLRGDYAALQNDFEQARMLAADFKGQLAGKTNEMAHLKQIFEKTALDLANLQAGITALREERHRLANEAMRAIALEHRLKRAEAENARLLAETEKAARREHERESQIAHLQAEVERLKQQVATARLSVPVACAPRIENAEAQALLKTAVDSLERLREFVNPKGATPQTRSTTARPAAGEEFIDISFEP